MADVVDSEFRDGRSMDLEAHRSAITAHCTRMLRSRFDADDAAQETMVRAWRKLDGFEGRSHVRTWLYRIATNVCIDMIRQRDRRPTPLDVASASDAVLPTSPSSADPVLADEHVQLAMLRAVRCLPARQRAVFVLGDVLRWSADETAELLGTTTAAVNSMRQRARSTLATENATGCDAPTKLKVTADERALVTGYLDALRRGDAQAIVSVLHPDRSVEDVSQAGAA